MKTVVEVKFQNSVNLFQFCRRVLDHKFGGLRVIDQDVGQILGFDPADCSHWKKGKKNIRSIQAMKSIADHLGVDERLVVDVANGELGDEEAFCEFYGYGHFSLDSKAIENARKDYYRRNAAVWTREKEAEFKARFDADEPSVDRAVEEIHQKINFSEAPLYLPEVINAYPDLKLVSREKLAEGRDMLVDADKDGDTQVIRCTAGAEMRPYVRFRVAKLLAPRFLGTENETRLQEFGEHAAHIRDVQGNLFAAKLLAPARLIRGELAQINVSKDIVGQLAEVFWVSKAFMNRRLRDVLESGNRV
jgi:hypothetical protein